MEHTHNHNKSHHEGHQEPHQGTDHTRHQVTSKLKGHAGALEALLTPIFSGLPHIPEGGRKVISDIIPWLSVIFGVLALIALLGSGMLGIVLSPLAVLGGGFRGIILLLTLVLGIISAVLSILAFKPLQGMKKTGWDYSFYALTVSAISSVLSIVGMMNGLGNVVGIFIGAYLLFEIRERYH